MHLSAITFVLGSNGEMKYRMPVFWLGIGRPFGEAVTRTRNNAAAVAGEITPYRGLAELIMKQKASINVAAPRVRNYNLLEMGRGVCWFSS